MASVIRTNSWLGVTDEDPWTESFDGTDGDCLCVVIDQISGWGGDHTPVKYDGVTMTEVIRTIQPSNNRRSIWYLTSPGTGSNTIEVTLQNVSTYPSMVMAAILMTGVDQDTPVRTVITAFDASMSEHQLTETESANGDVLVGVYLSGATAGPPTDGDAWVPEAGTVEFCDHYHDADNGQVYMGCVYREAEGASATVNDTADINSQLGSSLLTFIASTGGQNILTLRHEGY